MKERFVSGSHREKVWSAAVLAAFLMSGSPLSAAEPQKSMSENHQLSAVSAPVFSLPASAARVNGVEIPTERLWNRMVASAGSAALTGLVDEVLIEQEAVRQFSLNSPKNKQKMEEEIAKRFSDFKKQFANEAAFEKQLKEARISIEDVRRQIRLDGYKEKLLEGKLGVSNDEVRKYFEENRQKLSAPEQVRIKHILVATKQEADDLVVSLKAGASFEALARAKSLDQGTRENGGDLGLFSSGMLIPEMQEKAFALPVGGMDVVKSVLGFHVIKVSEKKTGKAAVLNSEVKENIRRALRQAKYAQVYPQWIQALRDRAQIQVLLNP
jgi:foldase protein PrsA